ncbi:curli assembly protein CsgF [Pistricoccus aurantiacus]|uniref:curli assembly protein CsgF n=1 Tax=Pistricoccus aurantiacus TaxID=1883414 RepID=UPI003643A0A9
MRNTARMVFSGVLFSSVFCGIASAGDLVYQPINPSFGGDPFYSAHLLQTAEIQNKHVDDGSEFDSLFEEPTVADQFASAINNTVISGAAGQLSKAIFEDGAPPSGEFTMDGAMVSYKTINGRVKITIADGINTNVLDIPIPTKN